MRRGTASRGVPTRGMPYRSTGSAADPPSGRRGGRGQSALVRPRTRSVGPTRPTRSVGPTCGSVLAVLPRLVLGVPLLGALTRGLERVRRLFLRVVGTHEVIRLALV